MGVSAWFSPTVAANRCTKRCVAYCGYYSYIKKCSCGLFFAAVRLWYSSSSFCSKADKVLVAGALSSAVGPIKFLVKFLFLSSSLSSAVGVFLATLQETVAAVADSAATEHAGAAVSKLVVTAAA